MKINKNLLQSFFCFFAVAFWPVLLAFCLVGAENDMGFITLPWWGVFFIFAVWLIPFYIGVLEMGLAVNRLFDGKRRSTAEIVVNGAGTAAALASLVAFAFLFWDGGVVWLALVASAATCVVWIVSAIFFKKQLSPTSPLRRRSFWYKTGIAFFAVILCVVAGKTLQNSHHRPDPEVTELAICTVACEI